MSDALSSFAESLAKRGIVAKQIVADGELHRCDAEGRNGKNDAAYVLHLDGLPAGGFINWRDGRGWETWRGEREREFTEAERRAWQARVAELKKRKEEEESARKDAARARAEGIWSRAQPADDDHPYLRRKGVRSHGLRQYRGRLVVPLRDGAGMLHSLQFIDGDGSKRFLTGGRVAGCFFVIGQPNGVVCVAEGYATAATVHQATGYAAIVAFDASNLEAVTGAARAAEPQAEVVVCADDDRRTKGNPGMLKARAAALAHGARVVAPEWTDACPESGSDFNDLAAHAGVEAVRAVFDEALRPYAPIELLDQGDGGGSPPPRYAVTRRIVTSSEFVAGFAPPDYVLNGILQRGRCYSFTADTGAGKTAITLLMLAHIALGRSLAGRECEQGRGLMLVGENPDDVRMRWIAMAEQMGFDADEIDVHFMPGVFPLPEIYGEIDERVKSLGGISFMSVDTAPAYFSGDDENDNKQLGDHARMIRRYTGLPGNPCVIANCHPVKRAAADNLIPRGGGAFLNEVDGNLCCTKAENVVELGTQGKFRGPEFEPIAFELMSVTSPFLLDSKGRQIPTVIARTITKFEQEAKVTAVERDMIAVMRIISESEGRLSFGDIAERAGWLGKDGSAYKMKAKRVVDELLRERLVTKHMNVWELTGPGEKIVNSASKSAKNGKS